ncbi:MAG: hypothetical protein KDI63_15095 [Gammaproteobacteria bacterium]|nr:hypothetical protein [Gammaproteobacteria bacterium]
MSFNLAMKLYPVFSPDVFDKEVGRSMRQAWLAGYGLLQGKWVQGGRQFLDQYRLWVQQGCELQIRYLEQYRKWLKDGSDTIPQIPFLGQAAVEAAAEAVAVGISMPLLPQERTPVADDLTRIQGLGKMMQQRLREAGIVTFEQILAWTEPDIARIEADVLGKRFIGRIARDQWQAQAAKLIHGD